MGYNGSIDTDAGIGTILSHFNSNYINHIIGDSLQMKFRPFDGPMPNMIDVLEREFVAINANALDYKDQVSSVRLETYQEIINKICQFYNFTFSADFTTLSPEEIYGVAHILYEIFISNFTQYMNDFFVSYIVNNVDGISSYLKNDETSSKPKESGLYDPKKFINPKFILVHANINKVIYNMAAYDISLQEMLTYFLDPVSAARIGSMLIDNGDVYKTHYACYILDQRYSSGVLTNIKLSLQAKTQEAYQI